MKEESSFVVSLIRHGREAGEPATPSDIGTLAVISDWHELPDNMLGIVCEGTRRFQIQSIAHDPDGLVIADGNILDHEQYREVPEEHLDLVSLLNKTAGAAGDIRPDPAKLNDASYVGFQLAGSLPLDLSLKQHLLESTDSLTRLDAIHQSLRKGGAKPDNNTAQDPV